MKNIIINYDFFNEIRNINEDFSEFKIFRNNQKRWIKENYPAYLGADCIVFYDEPRAIIPAFLLDAGVTQLIEFTKCLIKRDDIYAKRSTNRLKEMIELLKDLDINTVDDLITKTKCTEKITNLKFDDNKLPYLLESKYIVVPSIDYNNKIIESHLVQEHVIGSDTYEISKGKHTKSLVLTPKI